MANPYFRVERIDARTYAIHEPQYWQKNVSYLILGEAKALLFDTGPGVRDIAPLVHSLTSLPVTALPSHLHFDHIGNLARFDAVALPDMPALRARVDARGRFAPGFGQHLGFLEGRARPRVAVASWITPGSTIDLGGRALTVIATPGHSPESIALYDEASAHLFAGDFLYVGRLYACLPGADLVNYRHTALSLLEATSARTQIFPGHGATKPQRDHLAALAATIGDVLAGKAAVRGFPRRVAVAPGIELMLPLLSPRPRLRGPVSS